MAYGQSIIRTAKQLNRASRSKRALPPLFFFTDEVRVADPVAAIERLPTGTAVIFRHYGHGQRAQLAHDVVRQCRAQKRLCLVAGSAQLAKYAGADGVHWPEGMFRAALAARQIHPRDWVVTTSAHSLAALKQLQGRRVDGVFVSPVFPTASHPGEDTSLGPLRARTWIRESSTPVYLMGGIDARTAPRLASSGAAGFGAIGSLLKPE